MADVKKVDAKEVPVGPELTHSSSLEVAEITHEHADEALDFVEKHEGFVLTPEQDKAVLRKIDLRILPLVGGASLPGATSAEEGRCSSPTSFNSWTRVSWHKVLSMACAKISTLLASNTPGVGKKDALSVVTLFDRY